MSLFITFEGPEGAGKSTQIELVARRLRDTGHDVLVTREPGGTSLGERVRELLLDPSGGVIVPATEALLMSAARAQHVAEIIKPALEQGKIVLCDRFTDSTFAYQGAGRDLQFEDLNEIQRFATGGLSPDLVVLLDIPIEDGLRRKASSGKPLNRLDRDDRAFHQRVRTWYLEAARAEPERWFLLDALQSPEELASKVSDRVVDLLEHRCRTVRHNRTNA